MREGVREREVNEWVDGVVGWIDRLVGVRMC